MKTWHKGLIIGGAALAVLVPAGLVAADQMGPGNGNGQGRGNGSMNHDCTQDQMQNRDGGGMQNGNGMQGGSGMQGRNGAQSNGSGDQVRARDGSGARHDQIATTTTVAG